MKKIFPAVFALFCVAVCLVPSLGMIVRPPTEPIGNERKSKAPELTKKDGSFNFSYLTDLGGYYEKHFAFRPEMITADAQAPFMGLMCVAGGSTVFVETIFENRYKHIAELQRMGANITPEGRVAVVEGVKRLRGAPVQATDLRGGAALMIAALAADGVTEISDIYHIDRGYERPEDALSRLGANIQRI